MNRKKIPFLILMILACGGVATASYVQRPFSNRLSAHVTDLKDRSPQQRENILLAATMIDGKILQPGEVFSLNQNAGPYTQDRGYQPERSFREKSLIFSPGGGVCQLASTLFNSAEGAGLSILERIPHSQEVSSVPKGRDATVAYAWADLKFSNPHPFPIKIQARALRDQLLTEIWGKETKDD